ncbi:hypothetical protein ACFU8W_36440 [Streptomyces sp. NPDC057565]|uniref:hypothetical protein n=1 Tax=Streptomyces sp. NPDC057565 TaxID=3346169 RepID=UPI00368F8180
MRHVPFFRWVLTLGLVLIGCSLGLYMSAPGFPELRQIDLTVLEEKPDGSCRVRWTDPFGHRDREAPYVCDAERDPLLKAPVYDMDSGLGWDTGFVVAEGTEKGELYSLEEDGVAADEWIGLSDTLVMVGLLLTIVGLVGGNIRALARVGGVSPEIIRRARRLSQAAALVAQDHGRAVEAVHEAWAAWHQEVLDKELSLTPVARLQEAAAGRLLAEELEKAGVHSVRDVLDAGARGLGYFGVGRRTAEEAVAAARRIADEVDEAAVARIDPHRPEPLTTTLLVALWVLMEAGPRARNAAQAGRELAARLDPLLTDAAPASERMHMLRAGPQQRRRARSAVAELCLMLDEAEQERLREQFAQASVDLLRGPDNDPAGLSAWADFETRPAKYYGLLADVADRTLSSPG